MDLHQALRSCFLFTGLTENELSQIQAIAGIKPYSKGELIFAEGREATGFYIVASGQVKLYKISAEGKEQILHVVNPGETFAEAVMFSGGRYPAFAETLSHARLIYLPKKDFLHLIKQNPQLSLNMLATMSKLLRKFNRLIEELSLKDVSSRLAHYLIEQSQQTGQPITTGVQVELGTSKTQLASRLGTISETLSRTLRKLKQAEIIQVKGNIITILDLDALNDVAAGLKYD
jgi:CRP-like cAMP-binding protein